jgi:ribosomal RNA large subunit methyltransferase H
MIKVVAIGKRHEAWIDDGLKRYSKRLGGSWSVEWTLLPHSARKGQEARQEESGRILSRIKDDEYVILLDERGKLLDSPALSCVLTEAMGSGRVITIIIGGAYGVDDTVVQRANLVWSLSPLVFPHQLVRLILVEQLYRAQAIYAGHPYHHE